MAREHYQEKHNEQDTIDTLNLAHGLIPPQFVARWYDLIGRIARIAALLSPGGADTFMLRLDDVCDEFQADPFAQTEKE